MKAVILAGGFGTRLSEETIIYPKPMIEIGGKPVLWHIMKIYSSFGINDFIICLGHKGYVIKEYFANYFLHTADVTFDMKNNRMDVHHQHAEPWKITFLFAFIVHLPEVCAKLILSNKMKSNIKVFLKKIRVI
jgi:glucose-1-phosphate cytidylyltransferase